MDATRTCKVCGDPIPRGRLQALPDTDTCVRHSDAKPRTERDVYLDGPDASDMVKSVASPERDKG